MALVAEPDPNARERITRLLEAAEGSKRSAAELLPLVYDELRVLARARMANERPGQTLQATSLVHEAYLRVVGDADPGALDWNGRGHFFGAAARAMRRILIEQARKKKRLRHGGGKQRQAVDEVEIEAPRPEHDVLAIDEVVGRLEEQDPRKGEIVNLRYFAGLSNAETAAALGVSVGTIEREWRFIRAWLRSELGEGGAEPEA